MLKDIFKKARSNIFFKNVAILASGTIISQLIVIATSPVLSRIYLVESFGLLSLFTSYLTISAVISTGRYELALSLPEEDDDARKLVQLILVIGFVSMIFYYCLIFFLREIIHLQNRVELLNYWWIYFAPLYIFFIAVYSGLSYWFQRKKKYKKIAVANALQVIFTALLSIMFGLFQIEWGMILSLIISIFFTIVFLFKDYHKENKIFPRKEVKVIARRFISFPKYMTVSDLSLTLSQQLTPIFFSFMFSTSIVGFYSMANRMLRLPNIVITSAIGNVFRNDAIDEIRIKGNCNDLYKSTFKKLIIMALPIYLLLFILSPVLFSFFFWRDLVHGRCIRAYTVDIIVSGIHSIASQLGFLY